MFCSTCRTDTLTHNGRCMTCGRNRPSDVAVPPVVRTAAPTSPSAGYRFRDGQVVASNEQPRDEQVWPQPVTIDTRPAITVDLDDGAQTTFEIYNIFDTPTSKYHCACNAIIVWLSADPTPVACGFCGRALDAAA